jgi:ankyrin repeat protein
VPARGGGDAEVARALAAAGGAALLDLRLPDGSTCLHIACEKGSLGAARALLAAAGDGAENLLLARTHDGSTCLHCAAGFEQLAVVQWLAGLPAYPRLAAALTRAGRTALEEAVVDGRHPAVAEALRRADLGPRGRALMMMTGHRLAGGS